MDLLLLVLVKLMHFFKVLISSPCEYVVFADGGLDKCSYPLHYFICERNCKSSKKSTENEIFITGKPGLLIDFIDKEVNINVSNVFSVFILWLYKISIFLKYI